MEKDKIGSLIKPIPNEHENVVDDEFIDTLLTGITNDVVDMSTIDSFAGIAQNRENIYAMIDTMASDDRISAILETITEDCVETNDKGQVIWCTSDDEDVAKHVQYLIDTLEIDKHAYEWVYSLLRYGDLYVKMFRESDYNKSDDILFGVKDNSKEESKEKTKTLNEQLNEADKDTKEKLEEDIKVVLHADDDPYAKYVKMVNNPGEMFDLQYLGKTRAYLQAPVNVQNTMDYDTTTLNSIISYKMRRKDVTVYGAGEFVHACLRNSNNLRNPEEVQLFRNEEDYTTDSNAGVFEVRKGQSLLFNKFRVWRQLCMTENSILLDRVTKSALTRIVSINVAGIQKERIPAVLQRVKSLIEQKSSMAVGDHMTEYTNPGPLLNSIFMPVRGEQGQINISTIGGEYDPKELTDLDHLETRFYGSFRAPKQFFNLTDDSTGFNGGSSLTIISSRYGKSIKEYQKILCQLVEDMLTLILDSEGANGYIGKFVIHAQTPVTQEEIDRRENQRNEMGVVGDIMGQISGLEIDDLTKIKIYKVLISSVVSNPEVIALIQERIDQLEKEQEESKESSENKENKEESKQSSERKGQSPMMQEFENSIGFGEEPTGEQEATTELGGTEVTAAVNTETSDEGSYLPNPTELGDMNFMDNI